MVDTGKIRREKGGEEETALKRTCIVEYNRGMGGVDKQRKTSCMFPSHAKVCKRIQKIFFCV